VKKVSSLHEEFISSARRTISFDKLPIMAAPKDVPIVVSNKWLKKENKSLEKTYDFLNKSQRNKFIVKLFEYEEDVGHHATIFIKNNAVTVTLSTHTVDSITELDKEYARFSDEVFKDVIYAIKNISYTL